MSKQEPNIQEWLEEAKRSENASQCGMFLTHNGVVRATSKAKVRQGVEGLGDVEFVDFSYDAEGLEREIAKTLELDGIYFVKVWLNEGRCKVGDSLMYVLIGGDIRPHVIDALQTLVGTIKNELVEEKEVFA